MSRIFPHEWPPSRAGGGSAAFNCNWRQASKLFFNPSANVSTLFFPNSTPRLLLLPRIKFEGLRSFSICTTTLPKQVASVTRNAFKKPSQKAIGLRSEINQALEKHIPQKHVYISGKKKDRRRPLMDDPTWFDSHSAVIHAQKTDLRLAGGLCSVGDL
ncbi:hypothetical protein B0H11DRAFT_2128206, partial [Mycena galericulata]